MPQPVKALTPADIYVFIPNLIGYARVFTAILSFFTMKNHPVITAFVYGLSCLLDAFDGTAARKFNQATKFGAVLDMVTDRCTTSSLICFLAVLYPSWMIVFQLLISLDLASHYMHMYAMLSVGSTSHKDVDASQSKLLSLYYNDRTVLFVVCALNELFYMALYLAYFDYFLFGKVLAWVTFPVWFFKQVTNVIQMRGASDKLVAIDAEERNKAFTSK
ncbi:hypothetical protein BABINDRAFT_163191 [Babjeviella inositovora NRRL Y-12698]|uniref:CDP-diacylglycerol--inositol 3-phosphatidyltransferase n=1 Tax=Babjeviella inositovora NRRL Y-12698 TaxID=984486 RepID=A0A1E3QK10_9ASCO|nr:uncharacterized protein BABINDRAFT_163191 [Babjeviella inositovora NRRL Y-12698]ODQ77804.1 hypothetical protein BABINDRAFT_163191 [Babjeviella inositovora NRRL Y-12698]